MRLLISEFDELVLMHHAQGGVIDELGCVLRQSVNKVQGHNLTLVLRLAQPILTYGTVLPLSFETFNFLYDYG